MQDVYKKGRFEGLEFQEHIEQQPQPIEQEKLLQEYKNLIILKNNLFKVNLLLINEQEEQTIEELNEIKNELIPAIQNQEETIRTMQKHKDFSFNTNRLNSEDIDKLAKAYFESDKKWYNAKLLSIDTEEQEAEVQYIGYQDVIKLNAIYIKVQQLPDSNQFQIGQWCEAIYSQDGRYYLGSIERITDEGYHIKFKKLSAKEIVPLAFLRQAKKQLNDTGKQKNNYEEMDEFVVPDNLKYQPADNEQQRQAKKKKLKALKQQFKQSQMLKCSVEKQQTWQSFQNKVSQLKPDIGQKAESIYRGPEKKQQVANHC